MGFLQNIFRRPDLDAMAEQSRRKPEEPSGFSDSSSGKQKTGEEKKTGKVTMREYDRKLIDSCERLYRELKPLIRDRYESAIESGMMNFIVEKRFFMGASSMKIIGEMILSDGFGSAVRIEKSGMTVSIQSNTSDTGVQVLYDEADWDKKPGKAVRVTGIIERHLGFNSTTGRSSVIVRTKDGKQIVLEGWNIPCHDTKIRYEFYYIEENDINIVVGYRLRRPFSEPEYRALDDLVFPFFEPGDEIGENIFLFPEMWDQAKDEEELFSSDMHIGKDGEFDGCRPKDYLQAAMVFHSLSSRMARWNLLDDDLLRKACFMAFGNVKKARDISVYDLINRREYGRYLDTFMEDFNRFDYLQAKIICLTDQLQAKSGHLWIDAKTLLRHLDSKMKKEVDRRVIRVVLNHLIQTGVIINLDSKVFISDIFLEYQRVRRRFYTGACDKSGRLEETDRLESILEDYEKEQKVTLNEEQRCAVAGVIGNPTSIITGGPGTGKTFVVRAVCHALRELDPDTGILFTAPTGKAADNLASVVGSEGFTLHSILKMNPKTGTFDAANFSVKPDVLIVDETSMCDTFLLGALARKIGKETKVVFVGDPNQLQSVERGDIFGDMIESGFIPVFRLEKTYRQGGNTVLLDNARAIMRGNPGEMVFDQDQCTFIECGHDDVMDQVSVWYYHLASRFTPGQVKVISPYNGKNTGFGTEAAPVNGMLSRKLSKGRKRVFGDFRDGEIVMATKNTDRYRNGQTGRVYAADSDHIKIRFKNREIFVGKEEARDFEHGYATTINRSQGEEYRGIIIILDDRYVPKSCHQDRSRKHFFTRDRLYTAFTRGKEKVVLIGSRKVLDYVIKNEPMKRNTGIYS